MSGRQLDMEVQSSSDWPMQTNAFRERVSGDRD